MQLRKLILPAALLMATSIVTSAQTSSTSTQFGVERGETPVMEIGLNYIYVHANAPPAQCGCFSLNGGSGTLVINVPRGFGLVADISSAHASQVDNTTQNITLFDALGGVRYSYRSAHRYTPYAQALVGKSYELSNYAAVQGANSFAPAGGLGMSIALTRHIAWNAIQADYLYSRIPNLNNNRQSDIRFASGVIFRFGPR